MVGSGDDAEGSDRFEGGRFTESKSGEAVSLSGAGSGDGRVSGSGEVGSTWGFPSTVSGSGVSLSFPSAGMCFCESAEDSSRVSGRRGGIAAGDRGVGDTITVLVCRGSESGLGVYC